jgi:hypothetical protein
VPYIKYQHDGSDTYNIEKYGNYVKIKIISSSRILLGKLIVT